MRVPVIAVGCGAGVQMALALGLLLAGPQARADGLRSSVVVTSDYVQRGVSQTNGEPALQGSVAYWHPTGWYAGAWASNVETARRYYTPRGARTELNLFLGLGMHVADDWVVDAKVVRYLYPNDPAPVNYDYNELSVGLAWRERLYASVSVAPGTTLFAHTGGVRNRTAVAGELSFQQPLTDWFTWLLGGGYYEVSNPPVSGYFYGGTGLALQLHKFSVELMHFRTSGAGIDLFGRELAGPRTVITASLTF